MPIIRRWPVLIVVFVVGVASASLLPELSQSLRKAVGMVSAPSTAQSPNGTVQQPKSNSEPTDEKQQIKFTEEQIAAAKIDLIAVQGGTLKRRIIVPERSSRRRPNRASIREIVRHGGGVAKEDWRPRRKRGSDRHPGKPRGRGRQERISRRRLTNELQQDLFERDKALWEKRLLTEQQYLRRAIWRRRPACGSTSPARSCSRSA